MSAKRELMCGSGDAFADETSALPVIRSSGQVRRVEHNEYLSPAVRNTTCDRRPHIQDGP